MTARKKATAGKRETKKLSLKKETIRDLDAGKRAGRIKAGAANTKGCVLETIASCISCGCTGR